MRNKDTWGVIFSGLCLLHCLAAPLLVISGTIGVLGVVMASQWVHQLMIMPVVIFALFSFPATYKKHRHYMPILLAVMGVIGLIVSVTYLNNGSFQVISGYNFRPLYAASYSYNLDSHLVLTIISSGMLILAHTWNGRLNSIYRKNNGCSIKI